METYIDQISKYFENVPLWPFFLLAFVSLVAIAVEIVNRKRREQAIESFRETIEVELASMYPTHIRWPENVNHYLCSRLPEMQYNFEVLRIFIPQKQLKNYNQAWNDYRDFCLNITDEQCASNEQSENAQPDSHTNTKHHEGDPKEVFHKLVSDLLSYTKT